MKNNIAVTLSDNLSAALLVIAGYYGVDPERRKRLSEDGYNADTVQAYVNEIIKLEETLG